MSPPYTAVGLLLLDLALFASGLLFLWPLRHKPKVCLRAFLCGVVGIGGHVALTLLAPGLFEAFWLQCLVGYGLMLLLFWHCAELNAYAVLYCGVWAVVLQQLTLQVCQLVYCTGVEFTGVRGPWLAAALALFAAAYMAVSLTLARWMPTGGRYQVGPRKLTLSMLVLVLFEWMRWLPYSGQAGSLWAVWQLPVMVQIYCATLLYLQHELFQKSAMRQELALLNRMWAQQKEQYSLAKENIALINRKCHDLKHQVRALQRFAGDAEKERYLQEIEDSVRIYEAIAKTGNEALDTVLTEKRLYCEANRITAHCVADGSRLAFMDPVDLYTIFGNAMDNAIESVKQLQAEEKRIIDVLVYAENQLLVIQVINPLEASLTFNEDGLPQSTKPVNGYHGFGLKSIRHTAQKYGGFVTVTVADGCFDLRILLPLEASGPIKK